MVFIPAYEKLEHRTYIWYVSDDHQAASLWVRYEDRDEMEVPGAEYPIYQQTNGLSIWNSTNIEYGSLDDRKPTDRFWEILTLFTDEETEEVDINDEIPWYEDEALHALSASVAHDGYSDEIKGLLTYAERETRDLADIVDDESE